MRSHYLALLAASALLASATALSNVEQTNDAVKISPAAEENDAGTQRFLRVTPAVEDEEDEERGRWKDLVDKAVRKAKKYNKWIFSNKDPEWVAKFHPESAKGYLKFWENRMVGGGKYA